MIEERPFFMTVTITLQKRDDGGLRAYTDDIPGFVLSNQDSDAVIRDIIPALELLAKQNLGLNVKFRPAQTPKAWRSKFQPEQSTPETSRYYVAAVPYAA